MPLTHLALFTGIGGFHIAAEWAGFTSVEFSEIEPYCCGLLEQHWPDIPNHGNITTADFSHLRGFVTVLSAGVPCQPASLAGKRRGAEDDRWLWPAALDVVRCVQPAWCIFENPDGILSLGEFAGVLSRLGSLGYNVRAFRVPASALGAGHHRYRVFTVANNDSAERRARESGGNLGNGQEAGWGQSANGSTSCDQVGVVAGSAGKGRDRWRNNSGPESTGTQFNAEGCGEANSHAFSSGLEERQSFIEHCRAQFPATQRTGNKQHVLRGFWYAQPPLCGGVPRIPNRSYRLKALGNAVVPQQAYPFFAAIAQTEMIYAKT
jgi:DNA (cytosine-5)-methyltransferase 1